ncbi:MAG TPA: hypothetical protein VFO29_10300 [Candidatus Rubrimentiphilum sp.]|nr:hypothetical protein [Candidatus Rubrimentiphilum sp.]
MQSSSDLGNTFGRSWELLSSNWIMLVPGIVIGIVAAIIVFFVVGAGLVSGVGLSAAGASSAGIGAALMAGLIVGIIVLISIILTIAYTTGMAGAAWRTGRATLADGAEAFRKDGAAILVAVVLLVLLAAVAAFASIFTFGLALIAFVIFFMYTFASVIVGGKSGSEALGDSARIATRNFVTTLLLLVLICVVYFFAGWIGSVLGNIRLLGGIVSMLINQIVAVYVSLVIVGEYIKLSKPPAAVAAPPSAGPPATY